MFQLSELFPLNRVSMSSIWPRPPYQLQSISSVSILAQTPHPLFRYATPARITYHGGSEAANLSKVPL